MMAGLQVVLFLFKLRDETAENRRLAKELVEKWSRPIFEQHREPNNTERINEREGELRRAVIARQRAEQKEKEAGSISVPCHFICFPPVITGGVSGGASTWLLSYPDLTHLESALHYHMSGARRALIGLFPEATSPCIL
jgi:hypothetical protein